MIDRIQYFVLSYLQDTPVDVCLKKQNVVDHCDLFVHENCNYNENKIVVDKPVMDAIECQTNCQQQTTIGFRCKYWVFESLLNQKIKTPSARCTLYEEFDISTCNIIFGPEYPSYEDCI